jgi:hypothetical protein
MSEAAQYTGSFPLTDEHYQLMKAVQQITAQTLPVMAKCQDCGLDVTAERQVLEQRNQFASDILRNFFPGLP